MKRRTSDALTRWVNRFGVVVALAGRCGSEDTNNVLALAFGVFLVGLVVLGSMKIIHNLNVNMMPPGHLMGMR